jgi:hypothetical protein
MFEYSITYSRDRSSRGLPKQIIATDRYLALRVLAEHVDDTPRLLPSSITITRVGRFRSNRSRVVSTH